MTEKGNGSFLGLVHTNPTRVLKHVGPHLGLHSSRAGPRSQVWHTSGFTAAPGGPRWGHPGDARGVPHPLPSLVYRTGYTIGMTSSDCMVRTRSALCSPHDIAHGITCPCGSHQLCGHVRSRRCHAHRLAVEVDVDALKVVRRGVHTADQPTLNVLRPNTNPGRIQSRERQAHAVLADAFCGARALLIAVCTQR